MSTETTKQTVEFTADAEHLLATRTEAFADQLRLAAIDEAIRRRGSANEVTASDVLRASNMEQFSVPAYNEKLNAVLKDLELQLTRNYTQNRDVSEKLRAEFAGLLESVGQSKEEQERLQTLYRDIQEQTYASNVKLSQEIAQQIMSLKNALSERPQFLRRRQKLVERVLWSYIAIGATATLAGLLASFGQQFLRNPSQHIPQLVALVGIATATLSSIVLGYFYVREKESRERERERELEFFLTLQHRS